MYEMLTGELPFSGDTPLSTAIKRLKEPAPSPKLRIPDLDEKRELVIARCLERKPEQRFASAEEVVEALRGGAVPPRPPSVTGQSAAWGAPSATSNDVTASATTASSSSRWRWLVAAVVVALLASAATWIGARYRRSNNTSSTISTVASPGAVRKSVAILG